MRPLILVTATMVGTLAVPWVRRALSALEVFEVAAVEVEGTRHLASDEVRSVAAVPSGTSIWDDLSPIVQRIRAHPGVRDVEIDRSLPHTLVVKVVEREPIAFVPNPTLRPVDVDGSFLPFDPAVARLDLPLVHARREPPGEAPPLTPTQLRALVSELHGVAQHEPDLMASVSDVALDGWGDVVLHLEAPRVSLRYRPPFSPLRFQEGLVVLADALSRNPEHPPVEIDLRFADQVVVVLSRTQGP
jgi:cell division protein FtsQ